MNVRNCRKCGRIFNYVMGPRICPRCKEELEAKFQEVKAYIQDHHGADIQEVSRECDVEPAQINQWIREDRLQFAEDSPIRIPCEGCGAMLRSGRFCEKCKQEMTMGFNHAMGKDIAPKVEKRPEIRRDGDRMRYLSKETGGDKNL